MLKLNIQSIQKLDNTQYYLSIFRLAYFERKHNFYSQEDLLNEMIRHYTSQAIKQAYVIIFGLDVIGNPFGLVVGVSR